MPYKLNKIAKALNWMAVGIISLLMVLYIGANFYNANELGETFIYIAICTAPFLLVPLLTIWTLKKISSRLALSTAILANLILLLINMSISYLTYIEGKFHASNPQIYGNDENWLLLTFIVSTPLILFSINIAALIHFMLNLKPQIQATNA